MPLHGGVGDSPQPFRTLSEGEVVERGVERGTERYGVSPQPHNNLKPFNPVHGARPYTYMFVQHRRVQIPSRSIRQPRSRALASSPRLCMAAAEVPQVRVVHEGSAFFCFRGTIFVLSGKIQGAAAHNFHRTSRLQPLPIYIYIYIYHRGPVSRQTICVLSIQATMISQALREKLRPSAL